MSISVSECVPPRPFLKWAGGKSRLLSQYKPFFPQTYQTYYEPFLGGGAVFFYLQPPHAVLTDINPELVNVYACIRDQVEAVIQCLRIHTAKHCQDYYYKIRSIAPDSQVERAARLIYLNKTCFNGLYRENAQGQFNVPIGRYKNPKICDPDLLRSASVALRSTQIIHRSFESVLDDAKSGRDFVYFDPPYYPISRTSDFTAYSRGAFTVEDQVRLQEVFTKLARRGVSVMLSNSDCPFIRELYQEFKIYTIQASRAINCDPQKRGKITEVLILSH